MAKFFMDGKVYDTEQAEKVFASRLEYLKKLSRKQVKK